MKVREWIEGINLKSLCSSPLPHSVDLASPSEELHSQGLIWKLPGKSKDNSWWHCSIQALPGYSSFHITYKLYVLRAPKTIFLNHEWTTQITRHVRQITNMKTRNQEIYRSRNQKRQIHKEAVIIQHTEEQRYPSSYFIHEIRNIKHETSNKMKWKTGQERVARNLKWGYENKIFHKKGWK